MSNLQIDEIKKKAAELRNQVGGTIFAFPIHEQDPLSMYAVVVYANGEYHVFPNAENVSVAAVGVTSVLELLKECGEDVDYERNVRFVSYEAQVNAPDVTMRRLKKANMGKPALETGVDCKMENEEILLSARGILKMCYISMIEEKNSKAARLMDEYYKLLSMRKYGKTVSVIRREVKRMSKDQVITWIEQTYEKYVHDSNEIMSFMQKAIN